MKSRMAAVALLVFVVSASVGGQGQDIGAILGYPQTIYHNAKIVTVSDASFTSNLGPIAAAMAVRDGKILHVGSNDEVRALAGPKTQLVDLRGRTVMPGFVTVHNHPQDWVHSVPKILQKVIPESVTVQRFMTGTPQEQITKFPEVLAEAVKSAKPGVWIKVLFLWDMKTSPDDPFQEWAGTRITKAMLDAAVPNNPLLVRSRPMILSQSNSAMLNQKGIEVVEKEAPPWTFPEGLIARAKKGLDIGGIPSTRIIEREIMVTPDLLKEALRLDVSWWASLGQTTFGTFLYHSPRVLKSLRELAREGQLENRMAWGWGAIPEEFWKQTFEDPFLVADLATREGEGTDYIWYMGTGETAGQCVSLNPLPNRPKDVDLVMRGGGCPGEYAPGGVLWNALYKVVRDGGRLIGSHQFGDVDIDNILNLLQQASKEAGFTPEEIRAKRHSADHMQGWPRPDQVPIIRDLGMIVGGTNLYIHQDAPRWLRDYGEKALEMVVPRKRMIENGVMNGIEMDKPYEASEAGENAFTYLSWAITRKAQDGKVYLPEQRISREQALKTATIWGAHYVLKENELGSLQPGRFADFLVLDKDYLSVPEDQIPSIRILMTAVGGKIVHLVPSLAKELGTQPRGAMVELGGPGANW
jgi:predicted amidohydrolase YtcJ